MVSISVVPKGFWRGLMGHLEEDLLIPNRACRLNLHMNFLT